MRVVADPSAMWCATEKGAYVQTARGAWTLTGVSAAQWLDRLVPLLDGRHGMDQLTCGLDDRRAQVMTDLVRTLVRCGIAKVASEAADEPIQHWLGGSDGPAPLPQPVRVVGGGPLARALVDAVDRTGTVAPSPAAEPAADIELVLAAGPDRNNRAHACLVATATALWVMLPGSDGWPISWASVSHRAHALGEEHVPVDDPPPTATMLAATRLVRELVLAESGATVLSEPRLIRIDSVSLAATEHRCAPVGSPAARRRAFPWNAPALTSAEFSERVTRLCDDRLGVLGRLSEGALRQLPLHVSSVRVSDPWSGRPDTVLGHGPDLAAARIRAAATGLLSYASLIASGVSGTPRRAVDIADGTTTTLDQRSSARVPGGAEATATGLSWSDAVLGALFQLTARLASQARSTVPAPANRDELTRLYLDQLSLLDLSPEPADVDDPTGAHTAVIVDDTGRLTVSGTSPEAARRGVVELLLVRTQVTTAMSPPLGPVMLGEPIEEAMTRAWVARLGARLRELGLRAVATPLDEDPAVADLVPFLVRVVLIDV